MHNYYYDIVSMQNYDIIAFVRFCEVLYINLCIDHAKIFINLPPRNQKTCSFFCLSRRFTAQTDQLPVLTERFTDRNQLNWRLNLEFEFVRFWPVTAAYRLVY
jgi:REP element-mobilizing transposase RayT